MYYFNEHGHHVKTEKGHYRLGKDWIDTENDCWGEPNSDQVFIYDFKYTWKGNLPTK